MRILHVLGSLEYSGAAKQALLLGRGLAKTCDLRVCALQKEAPWSAPLRAAGAAVHALDWARPIAPLSLWRLRRLLDDFRPEHVHVWRLPALRALALAGPKYLQRCIVSQPLPKLMLRSRGTARLGMLERWLLRRVAKIVADGPSEAQCLELLGFGPECVAVISPGVELGQTVPRTVERGRRIVCVGNLEPSKGFREALRAADFLAYAFADLQFYIIGNGPYLATLQRFGEGVYHLGKAHLLGSRADADAWLASADVCWVPSLTATGRQVALEAMAAGRPVIASALPHLKEIVADGESGFLVPPGNEVALARRTRQLFLDDAWRERMGEAGRQRVRDHFAVADFIERCRALYGLGPQNDKVTS